ncbi:MAG TPA: DJ-1/PfpI family protein, partial [Thermodesulfobacteriota bacterium]|nr:DJ-1/PfpI family protein [Thermodesulfobacteriota bacterium]
MAEALRGFKVACLAADGVEQAEVVELRRALEDAGAVVHLVSLRPGRIQAVSRGERARTVQVHRTAAATGMREYDGLVIPGGLASADALRADPDAVRLVREAAAAGKPIGTLSHGAWLLVEAGLA